MYDVADGDVESEVSGTERLEMGVVDSGVGLEGWVGNGWEWGVGEVE